MAFVPMICPQCGGQVEVNDENEYGFCPNCGTRIMLQDVVKVIHTYQSTNQDKGANRLKLADRAFEVGNYAEAYDLYTEVLLDLPESFNALSRRGICALYLSDVGMIRKEEYLQGLRLSEDVLKQSQGIKNEEKQKLITSREVDICQALQNVFADTQVVRSVRSLSIAGDQVNTFRTIVELYGGSLPYAYSEGVREHLLATAIGYIDMIMKTKVQFMSGTVVNRKGEAVPQYKYYTMDPNAQSFFANERARLAGMYNSLPSRMGMENQVQTKANEAAQNLSRLQNETAGTKNQYKAWKKSFLEQYPQSKSKIYGLMCIGALPAAITLILLLISFFTDSGAFIIIALCLFLIGLYASYYYFTKLYPARENQFLSPQLVQMKQYISGREEEIKKAKQEAKKTSSDLKAFVASKK